MWADFPAGVPRPTGPINLLEGEAYDAARLAANRVNRSLSRGFGLNQADYQIHQIVPVKFGGSPTALSNKVGLLDTLHSQVTTWFGRLQRLIEGG
jgi:filamentous hemagglutinin